MRWTPSSMARTGQTAVQRPHSVHFSLLQGICQGRSFVLNVEGVIVPSGSILLPPDGRRNHDRVVFHGLKIPALVPGRDGRIEAAHLRGKGEHARVAAHHAGAQFLAVLDHEQSVLSGRQPMTQLGPSMIRGRQPCFELPQLPAVGVPVQFLVLQRRDDVFVHSRPRPSAFWL